MTIVSMTPYIARLRAELDPQYCRTDRDRVEHVLAERGITTMRELAIVMLTLGWTEHGRRWARVMGQESEE